MSVSHADLAGLELHEPFHYVQEGDPGAVGAGKYWLKVSTAVLKRRNDADSGWLTIGDGAVGAILAAIMDAKGNILTATADNTPAILAAGTDGQLLSSNSGETTGLEWIDAPSSGSAISAGVYASRPAAGTAGAVYIPTDAPVICYDDGAAWHNISQLDGVEWTLAAAPTTWRNQGAASITGHGWGLTLYDPAHGTTSSPNLRIREKNVPAAPYTVIARLNVLMFARQYQSCGLCLVDSVGGGVVTFGLGNNSLTVDRWNSVSSYGSSPFTVELPHNIELYLRIVDDNTNRQFSVSTNKQDWVALYQESRTAHITPDKVGFVVNNQTGFNIDQYATLLHWEG